MSTCPGGVGQSGLVELAVHVETDQRALDRVATEPSADVDREEFLPERKAAVVVTSRSSGVVGPRVERRVAEDRVHLVVVLASGLPPEYAS